MVYRHESDIKDWSKGFKDIQSIPEGASRLIFRRSLEGKRKIELTAAGPGEDVSICFRPSLFFEKRKSFR
jgi:hypothetical protein